MSVWKGTPGEWRALPNTKLGGHNIYDPHGIMIARTGTHSAGSDEPANAKAISAVPQLLDVAIAYEEWEADVILRGDWDDELPRLTQEQFDRLLEIQALRNEALKAAGVE